MQRANVMKSIELEKQEAEPVDEATKAALQIGLDQLRRGEGIPLDEVRKTIKQRSKAWRTAHEPMAA